jgi:hypothetical protein
MYNLRYHLASLASVFLALAVGLLLGGILADQSPNTAQDALIKGIENEIAQVREANTELTTENKNISDFSDIFLQSFVEERLADKRILILGNNDKDTNAAVAALENAGAETLVTLPRYDSEQSEWTIDEAALTNPDVSLTAIVNLLEPAEDSAEDMDSYLTFLKNFAERIQLPLMCASSDTEDAQLVEAAWKVEIPGTNQLRNRFGAYTLGALLSGADQSLYGTTPSATALFPSLPVQPAETVEGATP